VRDATFQAQVAESAIFLRDVAVMYVYYNSVDPIDTTTAIDWDDVNQLVTEAFIDIKPITKKEPEGPKDGPEVDYGAIGTGRFIIDVIKGAKTIDDLIYVNNYDDIKAMAANTMVKLYAVGDFSESLQDFIIAAFIKDLTEGAIQL
jgi:hypothetical protein